MDAQKELEKWKADFSVAKTPEEQAAHKKRFNAFLQSLSAEDKKAFAAAFQAGAKLSVTESQNLIKIVEIRQKLDRVLDFVSMSYIAKTISGKLANGSISVSMVTL